MLKETPLYAILSGFLSAIPLVSGLFMIFFSRIWMDDSNSLSPKDLFPKMKPLKGKRTAKRLPMTLSTRLPGFSSFRAGLLA